MTGIIGAMESEVNAIYAQMENKEIVEYNGIKFYKGSLYGKDVVVISVWYWKSKCCTLYTASDS